MRFIEFARIHHWEEILEMHAFDWKTLVNISLIVRKMVLNRRKHDIFYALYERQTQEIITFSCICTINLPGKCMFSAADSGVHLKNANE